MAEYNIRPSKNSDMPAILEFITCNMGTGLIPRTLKYWQWKHELNPFGISPCLLAEVDGKITGLRAFLRWKWQIGDQLIDAVRAVDTGTDPLWRRKGIFSRLTLQLLEQMETERVSFVFNTPNPSSRPGYLKMGWQDVGRIPVMIKLLRPFSVFLKLSGCVKATNEFIQPDWPNISELFRQNQLESFLTDVFKREKRLYTPRKMEYLYWRYYKIPEFKYYAAWKFEKQSGSVIIFRPRLRKGMREISLAEVFASQDEVGKHLTGQLIKKIGNVFQADYLSACVSQNTPELWALRKSGFFPFMLPGPHLTVKMIQKGLCINPCMLSNWRLSLGDFELF